MIAHDSLDQLFEDAKSQNANPLWTVMDSVVTPHPEPKAVPHVWRYRELRPLLLRAGELIATEQAERRVFMLTNPKLHGPFTTDTIYAGLQLIRPGEIARAHRHTSFALRFIVEGENAFTAVGGEKVIMQRGDLVLTPSWEYHDHGNDAGAHMIWLDGLDIPLLQSIPVNFAEGYRDKQYPSTAANGPSRLRYPWAEMEARLRSVSGPTAQVAYEYRAGGGPVSATIGAAAERIDCGAASQRVRESANIVYHVHAGRGTSRVGDQTLAWETGDTFCIPSWYPYEHRNDGDETAYLFRYDDRPMLEALKWYRREEPRG